MVQMADEQALNPTADVVNFVESYRNCKPQVMPGETMTTAWWFLQKAGKVSLFGTSIKSGAKLLLGLQIWGKVPIGPSNLCRPIGVFPQIWWSREALSSGTHSENVLLSSWKLNRILQKHIQKLVYICGRANLSSNSLFGFVFIDLRTFENSASLAEGLRQPSHYSWIGRRQCCLVGVPNIL